MKRLILLFLITLSLPIYARQHLVIKMKNSEQHIYSLREKPVITFEEGLLLIESSDISISYPIVEIQNYHFTDETTAIFEIEQEANTVHFTYTSKDRLLISGIQSQDAVHVYDISGRSCPVNIVDADNSKEIELDELNNGIFIISVNGIHTFKIYK